MTIILGFSTTMAGPENKACVAVLDSGATVQYTIMFNDLSGFQEQQKRTPDLKNVGEPSELRLMCTEDGRPANQHRWREWGCTLEA